MAGKEEEPVTDVRNSDMDSEMQQLAIDSFIEARKKNTSENEMATYMKKVFDEKYNTTWHCIVGKSYGCHVTPEIKNYIFFYYGKDAVVLFKCG